jgi:hypothetical protein
MFQTISSIFIFIEKITPTPASGSRQKMMYVENAVCRVDRRSRGSRITVEAKRPKVNL